MGNSGTGHSASAKVTGIPDPVGAKLGAPRPWKWLQVIW